jgi:hypothetical protein
MASNWPGKSQEPVLSPNGHVILYGAATELEGPDEIVRGHLVRWVDDSLTWHGESEVGLILPRAVSCDGFTVMGHEANKSTARVFPRSVRWRPGAGYETLPDDRFAQAMAPEGDALYGVQLGTSNATAMEWRDGAEPRALLELPTMGGDTFWGRGAGAFAFHDAANLWFVKAGSGEPVSSRTHLPDECINVDNPMRLSAGGRLVTFDPECGRNEMAVYWETMPPPNVSPQFPPPIPISDFFGNVRAVANEFPDTAGYTAKVAVGVGFLGNGINRGVVWNLTISHRYLLEEMLEHYGVDVPPSVVITSVSDVSDDARVFTGTCIDERDPGRQNIFRAVLPAGAFEMPARSRNP